MERPTGNEEGLGMHEKFGPIIATFVSLFSLVTFNYVLTFLGIVYWVVMIWSKIRQELRETRKDKEKRPWDV